MLIGQGLLLLLPKVLGALFFKGVTIALSLLLALLQRATLRFLRRRLDGNFHRSRGSHVSDYTGTSIVVPV